MVSRLLASDATKPHTQVALCKYMKDAAAAVVTLRKSQSTPRRPKTKGGKENSRTKWPPPVSQSGKAMASQTSRWPCRSQTTGTSGGHKEVAAEAHYSRSGCINWCGGATGGCSGPHDVCRIDNAHEKRECFQAEWRVTVFWNENKRKVKSILAL
jgi:hypothetical protein